VRTLSQPVVLEKAALAAVLTTLACMPQVFLWEKRPQPVWYLALAMVLGAFVLWAFVFAWHDLYTGRKPFSVSRRPKHWLLVTGYGVLGAALFLIVVDPRLRAVIPEEFPSDLKSWLASTCFSLFFTQLFLVFAPVAFFARLLRKREAVILFTVLFNAFVVLLKAAEVPLPPDLAMQMLVIRVIGVTILLFFYLEGGIWPLWWLGLLVQARHLPGLIQP